MTGKENGIIWESYNYGDFKLINGNRIIDPKKVKAISSEVTGGLNLLKYNPIMVDEEGNVYDGQHRLKVSIETNNPVYYVICPKMTLKEIAKLNSRGSNWKIKDFVNAFARSGNKNYIKLEELQKEYAPIKYNVLARMLRIGEPGPSNIWRIIAEGNFKVKHLEETIKILDFCYLFSYHKLWCKHQFMYPMYRIMDLPELNRGRLMSQMEKQFDGFVHSSDWRHYANQINHAYNFKEKDKIKLFSFHKI